MAQLFLRTTRALGESSYGFQWPLEVGATVTAPDWEPTEKCGNGLHGLLNGEGDSYHLSFKPEAIWWIVEADNAIDLGGKHKFPSCKVVAFGKREEITPMMRRMTGGAVHGLIEAVGGSTTITGGDKAIVTGGNGAIVMGGDEAIVMGGDGAIVMGGDKAIVTGGKWAIVTGGYKAIVTGGDEATVTGGDGATLIFIRWINGRNRVLTAYVGEDGILPNVPYRANADHTAVTPA